MKIIGFKFTKIKAEKHAEMEKDISINSNIDFSDVKESKLAFLKENNSFSVRMNYLLQYSSKEKKKENFAEINLEGDVMISVSDEEFKEIKESWKKTQMPESFGLPILNFALSKFTLRSISLQEELNLPSPFLNLPKASVKKD